MKDESVYPAFFGGPRRDCAIPVNSGARGDIEWSRELGLAEAQTLPALLIWGGHIVAATFPAMAVFTGDGNRLWERAKLAGSPAAIANGLLYYENEGGKLDAADLENNLALRNAPLPAVMNDEFRLSLLWPREKDFLTVVSWPGQEPEEPPVVSWRKTIYGERISVQAGEYEEQELLPPLFIPELGALVISMKEAIRIDVEPGNLTASFKIPLKELAEWSADAEGTLCVIGYDGGHKAMVALSLSGEEKWRWADPEMPDPWATGQPPIRFGSRRVYAFTDRRILAIEDGKLLWQYRAENGSLRHGSSLADGSLLATAGRTLLHLDGAGKELFSVSLDEEILTPPVVDGEGNIYVATAVHLVRIR